MPLKPRSESDEAPYQQYSRNSIMAMKDGDVSIARKIARKIKNRFKKKKKSNKDFRTSVGKGVKLKLGRKSKFDELEKALND